MRIEKNNDSSLFGDFIFYETYKSCTVQTRLRIVESYCNGALHFNALKQYEGSENITYQSVYDCFNALCLYGFNVDYVSDSFATSTMSNAEKIHMLIKDESPYGLFGKCAGHLLFQDWHFTYSITENLTYFTVTKRKAGFGYYDRVFVSAGLNLFHDIDFGSDDEKARAMSLGMLILAIKKLGEIETIHVSSGVRRIIPNNDDSVVVNKMPFQINVIDSSWLRTIVRTEGFSVRGHFRLQPYGVGRCERRLIYIKPFQKHGYVRTARKIVHERKAINS